MHCPIDVHWQTVKWILWYLHGTASQGISIVATLDFSLTCYTYVD